MSLFLEINKDVILTRNKPHYPYNNYNCKDNPKPWEDSPKPDK